MARLLAVAVVLCVAVSARAQVAPRGPAPEVALPEVALPEAILPEPVGRGAVERIGVLAAVVVPVAVTGVLWGYAEATQNDWRQANIQEGGEGPRAAVLNQRWHAYAAGTRVMVVVDLGAALGVGAVARPSALESVALAGAGAATLLLSHHLGHNAQQGQSALYFGTVAPTDRLARRIGTVPVALATTVATGAVLYLAYRVLD